MALIRKKDEIAPEGVRIRRGDGSTVDCGMLRDPDGDRDGCAMWLAVPVQHIGIKPGDSLEVGMLPARSIIRVGLPS
jgi:hypothetical protein